MAAKKPRKNKAQATKTLIEKVWSDDRIWVVKKGILKQGRGRPQKEKPLFQACAEKLPYSSLPTVIAALKKQGIKGSGVYIAHDSMGNARYVGRGNFSQRLEARRKALPLELLYYSFYVIEASRHEREVETLLIRAVGPHLMFNDRKKRVDIQPGDVRDFEAGTVFFERQRKKGPRKATKNAR